MVRVRHEVQAFASRIWVDVSDRILGNSVQTEGRDISRMGGPLPPPAPSELSVTLSDYDEFFNGANEGLIRPGARLRLSIAPEPAGIAAPVWQTRFIGSLAERTVEPNDAISTRWEGDLWRMTAGGGEERLFVDQTIDAIFRNLAIHAGIPSGQIKADVSTRRITGLIPSGLPGIQIIEDEGDYYAYDTPDGGVRLEFLATRVRAAVSRRLTDLEPNAQEIGIPRPRRLSNTFGIVNDVTIEGVAFVPKNANPADETFRAADSDIYVIPEQAAHVDLDVRTNRLIQKDAKLTVSDLRIAFNGIRSGNLASGGTWAETRNSITHTITVSNVRATHNGSDVVIGLDYTGSARSAAGVFPVFMAIGANLQITQSVSLEYETVTEEVRADEAVSIRQYGRRPRPVPIREGTALTAPAENVEFSDGDLTRWRSDARVEVDRFRDPVEAFEVVNVDDETILARRLSDKEHLRLHTGIFGNYFVEAMQTIWSQPPLQQAFLASVNALDFDVPPVIIAPSSFPGRPSMRLQGVRTAQNVGVINVTIIPPVNDGGSAITSYLLEYKLTISDDWIKHPNTSTNLIRSIGGLVAGNDYDVRVRAVNDVGEGPWSAVFRARPPAPPGPAPTVPPKPTLTLTGLNNLIGVAISSGGSGGATIIAWHVEYRVGAGAEWTRLSDRTSDLTRRITGLVNGTVYQVRARGVNSVGEGEWSDVVTAIPTAHTFAGRMVVGTRQTVRGFRRDLGPSDPAVGTLAPDSAEYGGSRFDILALYSRAVVNQGVTTHQVTLEFRPQYFKIGTTFTLSIGDTDLTFNTERVSLGSLGNGFIQWTGLAESPIPAVGEAAIVTLQIDPPRPFVPAPGTTSKDLTIFDQRPRSRDAYWEYQPQVGQEFVFVSGFLGYQLADFECQFRRPEGATEGPYPIQRVYVEVRPGRVPRGSVAGSPFTALSVGDVTLQVADGSVFYRTNGNTRVTWTLDTRVGDKLLPFPFNIGSGAAPQADVTRTFGITHP